MTNTQGGMNRPYRFPPDLDVAAHAARDVGGQFDADRWQHYTALADAEDRRAMRRMFLRGALVIAAGTAFCVLTVIVAWGQTWPTSRMSLAPGDGQCFAVVEIENRAGVYNRTEVLPTEHGDVSVHYRTVGGHNAADHDEVTVVGLPDGVAADPMEMDLPDGDTGRVCLMQYLGG